MTDLPDLAEQLRAGHLARRARLRSPPNAIFSSELDIISKPAERRKRIQRAEKMRLIERHRKAWEATAAELRATNGRFSSESIAAPLVAGFRAEWVINPLTRKFVVRYVTGDDRIPAIPAIRDILCAVATHYCVTVLDIKSRRRTKVLSRPRHVAYYLCKTLTGASLPYIGRYVGDKDHTSVLHGLRKIEAELPQDEQLRGDVAAIQRALGIEEA